MLVALLAIAVGATILSGLVTIYYDVPRQMGEQFRSYGANMIFTPSGSETATATEKLPSPSRTTPSPPASLKPMRKTEHLKTRITVW